MAKIKKIKEDGKLILPATIVEAVKWAGKGGENLADVLSGIISTANNQKVTVTKTTSGVAANVLEEYKFTGTGMSAEATIDIYKDRNLVAVNITDTDYSGVSGTTQPEISTSGKIGADKSFLTFTYQLADGTYQCASVDMSAFMVNTVFGDGLNGGEGGTVSVKIADDSEVFLTVSGTGVKLSGISGQIADAVAELSGVVDTKVNQLSGAVVNEIAARVDAIDSLSGIVYNNEYTDAQSRAHLQTEIDLLSGSVINNYNTLSGAVVAETAARVAADAVLSGVVETNRIAAASGVAEAKEETAALSGVVDTKISELSGAVEQVKAASTTGVTDLSGIVLANFNTLSGAVATEATDREAADNLLIGFIGILSGAVLNETAARISDINELSGIVYANEYTDAESRGQLQDEIDALSGSVLVDINSLSGSITTEIAARAAADAALSGRIYSIETSGRLLAEDVTDTTDYKVNDGEVW